MSSYYIRRLLEHQWLLLSELHYGGVQLADWSIVMVWACLYEGYGHACMKGLDLIANDELH